MKKLYSLILSLIFINAIIKAQAPNFQWAKVMGGTNSEEGWSITTDASGNVYTIGYFQGTADFDPGPGIFNLTSAGSTDIFISKLDASGNFVWARRIGGANPDEGYDIEIDAGGNVYTTGIYAGTVDFDPGAGTFNLTSSGGDVFVSKLDASGNFIWAKGMGGSGTETGYGIDTDASGNVYITGYFQTTADFDPNAGVFNLISSGGNDIFICKLDGFGNFVWAKKIGGTNNELAQGIAVDAGGNVYTTGYFGGTVDFDPGAGTFNVTSAGASDAFISKLDAFGNFVLGKNMGGINGDIGMSIAIDVSGNIYSSGAFSGTADFDPGAGSFNLTSLGSDDIFISKLDALGNFVWAKKIGGTLADAGVSVALDPGGNIYTTGYFQLTVDFDPNAGVYNLSSVGSLDIFTSKLDATGNFVWAVNMGGTSIDMGRGISLDGSGNIHTTGRFQNSVDFDPTAGTFNLTSFGGDDVFIQKLGQCIMPSQPGAISGATNICSGAGVTTYSVAQVFGATSYTWNLPNSWAGTSSTNSISAAPGSSGIFTVTASSGCGTSPQQTLNVTVNPLPTITVNSGSICSGQSFTMSPSGASSYTYQGGNAVVSPTASASYTVTGTSTAGCVSASSATSNITVNALPSISVNSGSICNGQSFTITPNGANTYTFSSGPVVSPTTTSSYSVSGTSTAGCVSSSAAISNVTVNALPSISINSGSICNGQSFTLTPNGASTYTFSSGPIVSPTTTSSYSVTGTSTAGCVSSSAAISNVTVNPLPTINASTTNTMLCIGQSATITASGASSYTFNPGGAGTSIVVSPSVTSTYTITGTDANGCTNSSSFTQSVSTCAGINQISNSGSEIRVYPNPFNDKITIVSNGEKQAVLIFNALGSLIYKTEIGNEKIEIDLRKENSGIYFVKIGTGIKKIIKE